MQIHPVFAVTVPPGDYILGDPCYSVAREDWIPLLEGCDYFTGQPIGSVSGREVLAFSTQYGDGIYLGSDGNEFPVDSGMIGLVPADLPGLRNDAPDGFVHRVRFAHPTICTRHDDGLLVFGAIEIDTADEGPDDD